MTVDQIFAFLEILSDIVLDQCFLFGLVTLYFVHFTSSNVSNFYKNVTVIPP